MNAQIPKKHKSPYGKTTALTMMKDEGPFVLEWVAHHLALGFTDIVAYTNDCTDGTDKMLMRLEALGLVYHRNNKIPENMKPQPSALKYAQNEPVVADSNWLITFDADEFFVIKHGDGTVDGLISAIKARNGTGIVATWRVYGSNNVIEWSRAPVSEQYTAAAPPRWNRGWGVKTFFEYDPEYWVLGIHRPKIKNKHIETEFPDTIHWLNGSGMPMEEYFKFRGWRSIDRTIGYDWVQMNHYAVKSIDSYALRKFRGNVNNKANKYNHDYWSLQNRNEIQDPCILRHAEKRHEIFEGLLTDPILHDLHFRAIEGAEVRLEDFKKTPEYERFKNELIEAAKIPIHHVVAKPPKARDKEAIAQKMSDIEKARVGVDKKNKESEPQKKPGDRFPTEIPYYSRGLSFDTEAPLEWLENHDVLVPVGAAPISPRGAEAAKNGKFERYHARNLPASIEGSTFVDWGAGFGFLAMLVARENPQMSVFAVENDYGLLQTGLAFIQKNPPLSNLHYMSIRGQVHDAAFARILTEIRPHSIRLSLRAAHTEALAEIFSATDLHRPKQIIIAGEALIGLTEDYHATRLAHMNRIDYALDDTHSTPYANYFKNMRT